MKPFRFGVQLAELPVDRWREAARQIETLGYSTLFIPDHFGSQWDPMTALPALSTATEILNVGSATPAVSLNRSRPNLVQI